ncbi:MAG: ABC transporter permease [Oscillospiraceae bacterium]|nr:ABC transporter permease [Oscillospiraceae bacterium]
MTSEFIKAFTETLYMVFLSSLLSFVLGSLLSIVLIFTRAGGLRPNVAVYRVLDLIINLFRSFPFMILIVAMIPLTRLIIGRSIGSTAAIVPLTIAAIPFVARLNEGSFLEVDKGVIEAAKAFGATDLQIVFKVMVKEAVPSILLNITMLIINLIGYSTLAGVVGGGGLGNLAYNYGYTRFQTEPMVVAVILTVIIVQAVQSLGNLLYKKFK